MASAGNLDILELIDSFHRFVLPLVVVAIVFGTLVDDWWASRRTRTGKAREEAELRLVNRAGTIRRIGLLHYGLALRALVAIVPELQARFVLGGFWFLPALEVGVPLVVALVNIPIGIGLRRLRPWARWADVAWNAVVAAIGWAYAAWMWHYGKAVSSADWPEIALTKVLPVFLLVVMLLPGTGRAFAAKLPPSAEPTTPRRPSLVGALTLGFLTILMAVIAVNAIDWVVRIRPEMNAARP